MATVRFDKVTKRYGNQAVVEDIDLVIPDGEFTVFVGPSGCGKSTLLRMLAGLDDVSSGRIMIGDTVVNHLPPRDRDVAMVFQNYALYPHMTVEQNIGFPLRMVGVPPAERRKKVGEAADLLELGPYLERFPRQLSGGQRQRVAMGRALVRDPAVFLFDEPLSNLDAALRLQMRLEIARLHRQISATMVYVTHDQTEAMTLADRIVVLREGRIQQVGTPRSLYNCPASHFVAGFIGAPQMNFITAEMVSCAHETAEIAISDDIRFRVRAEASAFRHPRQVSIGVRPEDLELSQSGPIVLRGRLRHSEFLGGTMYLYVDVEGSSGTYGITLVAPRNVQAAVGELVAVSFGPADCHIFSVSSDGARLGPAAADIEC
jgi:multiple sugar transport system ATP-binding protein